MLCRGLELPIKVTESILCMMRVWEWDEKKSWKQISATGKKLVVKVNCCAKLSFLRFILVIARVTELVDTLTWTVLRGNRLLLERLKHVFSKSFCCIVFQGWDDVSFHGSPQIPTPHIDKLANEGVILNSYYVSPICTPTRASIMTGKHPVNLGKIYISFTKVSEEAPLTHAHSQTTPAVRTNDRTEN